MSTTLPGESTGDGMMLAVKGKEEGDEEEAEDEIGISRRVALEFTRLTAKLVPL